MKKIISCLAAIAFVCSLSLMAANKEYKTVTFDVDIECQNCVKKVTENISFEKGVKGLEVSLEDHTVTVTFDPAKTDEKKLAEAIRKLGYSTKVCKDEAEDDTAK